ncbi:hypothetical protein [Krasilnikovia sp. M28-CT-15]|uniref:hypothetical protein n=1 Tax=Krasilnikovia sp. M28-CT-15 TaxID=3373540 RepID=UPI003877323B
MTADLDRALSTSLQERADAGTPIDPQPLLHIVVERGQRLRVRRRVVATALAIATVAAVATNILLPRQHLATPVSPHPSPSASPETDLRPPPADGQPGATARPDLVGTDPGLLHFSVDVFAARAGQASWTSEPGVESAEVYTDDFFVHVSSAESKRKAEASPGFDREPGAGMSGPAATTVGDRPATVRISRPGHGAGEQGRVYSYVWQPVDGLWARADVQLNGQDDPARAVRIAQQVRFDQVRRCVLPIRLGSTPGSATATRCWSTVTAGAPAVFSAGALMVVDGDRKLHIQAEWTPPGGGEYPRPLKAGPYRVFADPGGRSWTMKVNDLFITATININTTKHPFTQAEVLRTLGDLHIADQLQNPAGW